MRTKLNFRTMSPSRRFINGIYGEDFLTFGVYNFNKTEITSEEELLEITKDGSPFVEEKTTFKFDTDRVIFKHEINKDLVNPEVIHEVPESALIAETF